MQQQNQVDDSRPKQGRKPLKKGKRMIRRHVMLDPDTLITAESTGNLSKFLRDAAKHYIKSGQFIKDMS